MNFSFHIARTDQEREDVYRFRQRIREETMQTPLVDVDQAEDRFRDENDASARLLYAMSDEEMAGAVRLHFGVDFPFTRAQQLTYNLRRFYQVVENERILVITQFLLPSRYRDSSLPLQLLHEAARLFLAENIALVICDCQPLLISFFQRVGFRSYQCDVYNDPEFGLKFPLALIVDDLEYQKSIASPLLDLFEGLDTDTQIAHQLVPLLGNATIKDVAPEIAQGGGPLFEILDQGRAPIFENLDFEAVQAVVNAGHIIDFMPDDQVIGKDRYDRTIFILLSGAMEIRDGNTILRLVEPGEVIGELAFLLSTQRTVDIFAGPEGAQVLSLDETNLRERLDASLYPEALLLLNLSKILAKKLAAVTRNLQKTQQQLIQQEKLASLGQLTAGIAHELKNPLNFINNFAGLNKELTQELLETLDARADLNRDELAELVNLIKVNSEQTEVHGKRADAIVQDMMSHASQGKGEYRRVSINELVDNFVRMSYQSYQSHHPNSTITIDKEFDSSAGDMLLSPKEFGRVLQNILNNAYEAVDEKKRAADNAYEPAVSIHTHSNNEHVEIRIADNGPGISREEQVKIFDPFYTTKPPGSGIGLGLSLSYNIVTQGHGGKLRVESEPGKGATFIILLPVK